MFSSFRGDKVNPGLQHHIQSHSDCSGLIDTSTQIDAQPQYEFYSSPQKDVGPQSSQKEDIISPLESHHATNVYHRNQDEVTSLPASNSSTHIILNGKKTSFYSNRIHDEGNNNDNHVHKYQTLSNDQAELDLDKANRNLMVQLAVWFAKKCKCSMPSISEEDETGVVSLNPCGNNLVTKERDISDSQIMMGLRPSDTGSVSESSSKSSTHSHGDDLRTRVNSMFSKLSSKITQRNKLTGDVFMAFSTVDGYNSKRHPTRGSWFVTLICQVFAEHAKDTDLVSMMEDVDRRLRAMCDLSYGTQMYVKKTEGFSKKFFFNVELED